MVGQVLAWLNIIPDMLSNKENMEAYRDEYLSFITYINHLDKHMVRVHKKKRLRRQWMDSVPMIGSIDCLEDGSDNDSYTVLISWYNNPM